MVGRVQVCHYCTSVRFNLADSDPVKLKQLAESLASVLVVTNRYLDQATTEMYNLYAQSEDEFLASLAPARYSLDEVTLDLAFVIDKVEIAGGAVLVEWLSNGSPNVSY